MCVNARIEILNGVHVLICTRCPRCHWCKRALYCGASVTLGLAADVGRTQITGTIPASIGDLTSLNFLYLNGNRLRGTIPKEIGQLHNLQHLGLWTNALEVPLTCLCA